MVSNAFAKMQLIINDLHRSLDDGTGSAYMTYASRVFVMLSWTLTFLVVALLSALLGFTGLAGTATAVAKMMFGLFLIIFLVSAFWGRKHV